MLHYEEMYLARLKYELKKRDGRVTGRKWELFQQITTAELMVSIYSNLLFPHISPFMFIFN